MKAGLCEGTAAVMAKDEGRQQAKLMRAQQSTEALKKPLALCLVCQLGPLLIRLDREQPLSRTCHVPNTAGHRGHETARAGRAQFRGGAYRAMETGRQGASA